MTSLHLLEKTELLWGAMESNLNMLARQNLDALESAQLALNETDEKIRQIKSWVINHKFDCWKSEITFFKSWKPRFIAKFNYYAKIISLLSSLPAAGEKALRKIYETEFEHLAFFAWENKEFISYYRRKATYMDHKFFIRFKYDLDVKLAPDIHSYDEKFSSSHDHLVSQILANDEYEAFLRRQIIKLKPQTSDSISKFTVKWSASKTALTELVFALHQTRCFNGGNISLSEFIKWVEECVGVDLGNYHKTMGEIKMRKSHQTKFIQLLNDNLKEYLEREEEMDEA